MRITYRPEIDGLRAIAVLLVIFYHAEFSISGINIFKAGFIGVDIFFVISGYLITSIILKELKETKKFSFLHFYERRIRRLIPALLFVMLCSFPFAWLYLLPGDFIDYSKSILYSIAFTSNFYFHLSGLEYGTSEGLFKPFLHTWSLSVEEQYYIIFPITLIFFYKFLKKNILYILTVFLFLSLITAELMSNNFPSSTFYFLHSRIWELLAGSILAYLEINKKKNIKNFQVSNIGTIFGLLLILFYFFYYNSNINHPSLISVIPVIGVCLIIWFSNKDNYVTKVLSTKPFVGVGLISYSLYLWHFPIFAFARTKDSTPSEYDKIEWLTLTFILSIITYFIVEKFFKNRIAISSKSLIVSLVATLMIIVFSNFYVIYKEGFNYKYKITENYTLDNKFYLDEWKEFKKKTVAPDFKNNDTTKVLIIGNSHGVDTFNTFYLNQDLFNKEEFSIVNTHVACFYFYLIDRDALPFYCIEEFSKKNLSQVDDLFAKANVLVISTFWADEDIQILDKLIEKLKSQNKKVLLFNSSLEVNTKIRRGLNILDFFVFKNKRLPNPEELKDIESQMFNQLKNKIKLDKKLEKIAKNKNIKIFLKEEYLCDFEKKRCSVMTDEFQKISWDYAHYTLDGAKYLGKKIYDLNWFRY